MDDIKTWLNSQNKEYTQGVALLVKYHKNKMLIKHFSNANPKFHAKKLEYELKKLSGIPLTVLFAENSAKPKPACVAIAMLPEVIRQAKNTVYELFTNISKTHRQLFELGESNSEEVIAQRQELLEKRLPLIERYEKIYLLKEQYFMTGVIPLELPLLLNEQAEHSIQMQPCNLQNLSGVELMKRKQAVLSFCHY